MPWYSSIGLFRTKLRNPNAVTQFEERVVIVRAKSAKIARKKILAEFAAHVKEFAKEFGVEYLKEYTFEELILAPGSKVVEVASLSRVSDLAPNKYIKRHWEDLRPVSCAKKGWKHAWNNYDDKSSRCYNCQIIKKGQLWRKK